MIESEFAQITDYGTFLECTYYYDHIPRTGSYPDPSLDLVFICNKLGLEGKELIRIERHDSLKKFAIVFTLHYNDKWETTLPHENT